MTHSMPQSSESSSQRIRSVGGQGKRHCWECRRRCLVCDSEEPGCKRCHKSGIPCPGYGDEKPTRLKWITPGRVVSRDQKHKKTLRRKKQDDYEEITAEMIRELTPVGRYAHITIPRIELSDEVQVIAQSLEYCRFPVILLMCLGLERNLLISGKSTPPYTRIWPQYMILATILFSTGFQ